MQTAANTIRQILSSAEYVGDDGLLTDTGRKLAEHAGLDLGYDAEDHAYLLDAPPRWADEWTADNPWTGDDEPADAPRPFRLGSVISGGDHAPAYGPENEPVRPLIDRETDATLCYVHSDDGPSLLGPLSVQDCRRRGIPAGLLRSGPSAIEDRRGWYYLAPVDDPTDAYAAGWGANVFPDADEAEAAARELDGEWTVERYS